MPVTIEKVMKDLKNFPYEIQMYIYHVLNNRHEEGSTYLEAYKEEEKLRLDDLKNIGFNEAINNEENKE